MAKNDFNQFLIDMRTLINGYLGEDVADADVPANEDDDDAALEARRAELLKKRINTLRELVRKLDKFDDEDIDAADKDTLVKAMLVSEGLLDEDADEDEEDGEEEDADADEEEADDEDSEEEDEEEADAEDEEEEDDEEDEEEGDEEEDEGYTEESLKPLKIAQLKAIAVDAGYGEDDLVGYKKQDLIDLILNGDEEEEGDEEEDAEEEEEVEAEEEEQGYTEDEVKAMSPAEVRQLAKDLGVRVKPGMKKPEIIAAIFA